MIHIWHLYDPHMARLYSLLRPILSHPNEYLTIYKKANLHAWGVPDFYSFLSLSLPLAIQNLTENRDDFSLLFSELHIIEKVILSNGLEPLF